MRRYETFVNTRMHKCPRIFVAEHLVIPKIFKIVYVGHLHPNIFRTTIIETLSHANNIQLGICVGGFFFSYNACF